MQVYYPRQIFTRKHSSNHLIKKDMSFIRIGLFLVSAAFFGSAVVYLQPQSPQLIYPLSYHKSWSPEQRQSLHHLRNMVRDAVPQEATTEALAPPMMSAYIAPLIKRPFTDIGWLYYTNYKREALKICHLIQQVAATGRGDVYDTGGGSPAYFAIHLGMFELAKELVRRGADPNHPYMTDSGFTPKPTYETLLCHAVSGPAARCISDNTYKQTTDMVQWLLEHGADPNKNHHTMLTVYCQMEMLTYGRCDGTELILNKLHSISHAGQCAIASTMLQEVDGSWNKFEKWYNKGLFTREGLEGTHSALHYIITGNASDTPQKIERLLRLGFNPNHMLHIKQECDFESSAEYEQYVEQLDELPAEPPLLRAMSNLRICSETDTPQQQTDKALQIVEILLKYGATAELHEEDLPKHEPTRAATLHLLKKYNLPVPGCRRDNKFRP